jgi:hypothetical protein
MKRHKQIDEFTQGIADKVYYFQSEFGLDSETLAGTLLFAAMDLRDYGTVMMDDMDADDDDDDKKNDTQDKL